MALNKHLDIIQDNFSEITDLNLHVERKHRVPGDSDPEWLT